MIKEKQLIEFGNQNAFDNFQKWFWRAARERTGFQVVRKQQILVYNYFLNILEHKVKFGAIVCKTKQNKNKEKNREEQCTWLCQQARGKVTAERIER